VSSVLFVFWYHSPNVLDTPDTGICNISRPRVNVWMVQCFEVKILCTRARPDVQRCWTVQSVGKSIHVACKAGRETLRSPFVTNVCSLA
jgi:hypothetical protein